MSEEDKNIKKPKEVVPKEETKVEGAPVEATSEEEVSTEETLVDETSDKQVEAEETPVEATSEEEAKTEEASVEAVSEEDDQLDGVEQASLDIPFIIGKKIGMTRLFDDEGRSYPVTLIEAGPCYVTQIKSLDTDGYSAVQIGYLETKQGKLSKPRQGHLKSLGDKYLKHLKECKMDNISDEISVGGEINTGLFDVGDLVNVSGSSKGKGFAGHMKRYNFSGGRASHGKNSVMRKAGSVGAGTSPGKVWKGTRMAGRMGNDKVTVENLQVIKINNEENTIFLNGSIPGSKNSIVYLSKVL